MHWAMRNIHSITLLLILGTSVLHGDQATAQYNLDYGFCVGTGNYLGDIGGDGNGTSAGLLDRFGRLLHGVGTPRGQRHGAAVARQLLGDCAPDPARRPRDECCASGQVMRVVTVVVCHRLPFD